MPGSREPRDRSNRHRESQYSTGSRTPPRRRSRSKEDRRRSHRDEGKSPERRRHRSSSRERRNHSQSDGRRRRSQDENRRARHRSEVEHDSRTSKRRRTRSPSPLQREHNSGVALQPLQRSSKPLPSQQDAFVNDDTTLVTKSPQPEKQKANFGNTGRLAAASNTINASGGQSIILKYHEPPEARKPSPKDAWRMYVFKGSEIMDTVELAEQSCWLFGREAAVTDFLVEHPSCSKQHAVIQFRYIERKNEYGDKKGKVRPYVIDLESANGTKVNEVLVPAGRYVELRDKDVVTFGHSTREYVVQLPPAG